MEQAYFFTLPAISETSCGAFSYEIYDAKTGQPLEPAIFVVDEVTSA